MSVHPYLYMKRSLHPYFKLVFFQTLSSLILISFNQLQIHLNNISNRHMKTMEYANEVTKVGQILAELYKVEFHSFEDGYGGKEVRPVVYADAEKLVAAITEARSYLGIVFVKVMADGGQGFLKICITVLPENYNPDLDRAATEEDELLAEGEDNLPNPGKRSTYKEGGGIGTCKLTSVKKGTDSCNSS